MSRRIALGALALLLIWLYAYLLVLVFGYASTIPVPDWWRHTFGPGRLVLWMWILPYDVLVTALVSAPFALAIALLYERAWLIVALLVAGTVAATEFAGLPKIWPLVGASYLPILAANTTRLLVILPMLTWLARRLPSN